MLSKDLPGPELALPPTSAEFEVMRMWFLAELRSMDRRRAKRLLRELALLADVGDTVRQLLPYMSRGDRSAQCTAMNEGAAWVRLSMAELFRAVPPA